MDDAGSKTDPKNVEWLKTKLSRVWNSTKVCGMCLEEQDNLCPLNMEFVISKQKSSKSFVDLLNYVFNEDVENLVTGTGVCENCTEKALQAYIFINNTRQISRVINDCVNDIYSKVVDLSEQLDDTIDCDNANIMIVLESEPQLYDIIDDLTNMEIMPTNSPKIIKKEDNVNLEEKKDMISTKSDNSETTDDLTANTVQENDAVTNIIKANDIITSIANTNSIKNYYSRNLQTVKKQPKINVQPEIYLKGGNIVINPINTNNSPSSLIINTYKCSECTEIFTSYRALKEHEKSKHKEKIYQCSICNKIYNTLQYLNIHYKTHFKSICKICRLVLPETKLMEHLRTKHATAIQIHPCKFCDLVYYSEEALETHFKAIHLRNCTVTEETKNQCPMCLRNVPHSEDKRHKCKFQCSECFVNPCIHYRYLTKYREEILRHSNTISCVDCDYVTKRKEYLIIHANREHLNHHPFICNDCGTQFYTKMSLRIHIEQYHSTLNICEYCDLEFKKSTKIKEHKEACKKLVRPHPCKRCVATFDCEEELTNHENLRHNDVGFSCHMCQRRFLNMIELEEHIVSIHRRIQCKKRRKNIDCTLCDIKFNSVKEMLLHESMHSPDDKYPCKVCLKEFYSLKKLYIHKQRHYERIQCGGCKKRVITSFFPQHEVRCPYKRNATLTHMCETCGKSFHLESLLRLHQKTHSKSEECAECGKMLKPSGLLRHLEKVHNIKEPNSKKQYAQKGRLSCNECEYSAKRKWVLEAHVNRYHLKVKPFVCNICKKEFCGKSRLSEHMATHSDSNTCYCSVCGKKFANKVCLKLHFRMHTGETPYACDICGEKFRTSSIMKTHRVKKHLHKTVACPMCDSMFYMARDMRHHFKKTHWKHKDKPFDVKEVLPEEYYHLFEDGRMAKITDEVIETEVVKSEMDLYIETEQ
ncbi:hypothetical protein K1T71_014002 [Dendrolimus kikuchii]|uniref:Uncharacterized protein n=1 Tax=Dendrolimus kikuchii TaxID=765133 RepID=A0ACC1CGL4_9NEOP|nr:hypothetical protein K1T71_014002 [Dendrolimus kikuchii]